MQDFLPFIVIGLTAGSVYGLAGTGLVLTYKTSGVFNFAYGADGVEDVIHKHPVADECLVIWAGRGRFYMGDRWVEVEAGDAVLAPCGVAHGHVSVGPALFGGSASPPQLDLVITDRGVYRDGRFVTTTTTTELTVDI